MSRLDVLAFRAWFAANGGVIHPSILFKAVPSGLAVSAAEPVPADATVITCPFALAITPALCTAALTSVFASPAVHAAWSEKQLVCAYVALHWVLAAPPPPALAHAAYLAILPARATLRTPLHFTDAEARAFRGTNLYGAAVDARRAEWQREWRDCRRDIAAHDAAAGSGFTWDHYLTAATYLSSRAFPSTILSAAPSLRLTPASHPVLLPGIDSLNHAPGAPVSWVVSHHPPTPNTADISNFSTISDPANPNPAPAPATPALAVSLVLHRATPAGAELCNNYGPKPNAELVLGYGFALPANPADTIVLQIGVRGGGGGGGGQGQEKEKETQGQEKGQGQGQGQGQKRLEVGRDARGAEAVWAEVLALVAAPPADAETPGTDAYTYTYEDELEAAGVLGDMLLALQDRLPDVDSAETDAETPKADGENGENGGNGGNGGNDGNGGNGGDGGDGGIRPEVREMLAHYVDGQRDIVRALLAFAQGKERAAIEAARAQGIELVFEDGAEDAGEEDEDVDADEDDSDEPEA